MAHWRAVSRIAIGNCNQFLPLKAFSGGPLSYCVILMPFRLLQPGIEGPLGG